MTDNKITTYTAAARASAAVDTLLGCLTHKMRHETAHPVEAFQIGKLMHAATVLQECREDLKAGKIHHA